MTEIELTPIGSSEKALFYFNESEIAAIAPNGDHTMIFLKHHSQPFLVLEKPEEIKYQFSNEGIADKAKKKFLEQWDKEQENDKTK